MFQYFKYFTVFVIFILQSGRRSYIRQAATEMWPILSTT